MAVGYRGGALMSSATFAYMEEWSSKAERWRRTREWGGRSQVSITGGGTAMKSESERET
jgi:hypothetical protein